MIFERALRRELAYTTGAVFMVFMTVMLTTLVIRILGFAANGRVNPGDVLVLIGLAALGYLAVLLMISLFVAVLIVLTRWYRDSEMVVWFSSGLSLQDFIRPTLRFATPLIALIAMLSFVGWPWANQQSTMFRERFEQRDDVSLITPGQFRESAGSNRVFFIEKFDQATSRVNNLFVASTQNGNLGVAVAGEGRVETRSDGDRYIVLDKGRRYEGEPGKPDFRIVEFDRYGIKVQSRPLIHRNEQPARNMSTLALVDNLTPPNLGELLWRIGLPMLALVLVLTAIPLAYVNPRRGRYTPLIFAVLIYLLYSNLLSLSQAWVAQSRVPFMFAWWPLPATGLLFAALLFSIRSGKRMPWQHRHTNLKRFPQ